MFRSLYTISVRYPKTVIAVIVAVTIFLSLQIPKLQWETDARVYLPKGHSAIIFDEQVDELFGVKDAVIIGLVNEKHGVFNKETLQRIKRITEKVSALPGVIATRSIDVASLSTATVFVGTETELSAQKVMAQVPDTEEQIEALRSEVAANSDLLVGNVISADYTAAMIRARLKEGAKNRWQTYFAIKHILDTEQGKPSASWGGANSWSGNASGNWGDKKNQWWNDQGNRSEKESTATQPHAVSGPPFISAEANGDAFYVAGRPVIEVTTGLDAQEDIKIMVPLLVLVMSVVLFVIFKTLSGVMLPLFVMTAGIIWTMGAMALLDVPLYTISTMLPVILVAVGIGDAVHFLSHYYDAVLKDPHRPGGEIVLEVADQLGTPMLVTSVTTAIGFLTLLFAEMPPFRIFGLFTVIGIMSCWLITVMFISAMLTVMKPKVGGYLAKRRAMRAYAEQSVITRVLVNISGALGARPRPAAIVALLLLGVAAWGSLSLFVDSSWMSDFRNDSEVALSTRLLNEKFDGTIFLHVVVEGDKPDALKRPEVLRKIEALQSHIETLPYVGDSLSIVDYLKSLNKNLHAGNEDYNRLPETQAEIGESLFLLSLSGRPEQLDEIIDYDYRITNVSFSIKTDHTRDLKTIIDGVHRFVAEEFKDLGVKVNLAGSANNSYIWADLLIHSQTSAIVLSKVGILLLAALLFRSFIAGLFTIIPVSVATLLVAGAAGFLVIPLDVSTALAAGVAIGVGVDYAVHYIYRYRREIAVSTNEREAIAATTRSVGRTIFFNATVVTLGFLVLLASRFPPHVKLGAFVAAYMGVSCVTTLVILPLLISIFRPRFFRSAAVRAP